MDRELRLEYLHLLLGKLNNRALSEVEGEIKDFFSDEECDLALHDAKYSIAARQNIDDRLAALDSEENRTRHYDFVKQCLPTEGE